MDLDELLKSIREEGEPKGGQIIAAKKFFGEDKYDKYYQELLSEGRIEGDNLSPQERKEGVKAYKKSKIDFETFVNKVTDRKKQVNVSKVNSTKSLNRGGALVVSKSSQIQTSSFFNREEESAENIDDILIGIDSIIETLRKEESLKKKAADEERKQSERKSRSSKEKSLENNIFKGFIESTKKVLKPVKSIFDRLFNFVSQILIGNILTKIVDWFSDEGNKQKLSAIGTFLEKTWPALLGTYLLFGNSFGRFVARIVGMTLRFIPKLAVAFARLVAAHPLAAAALGVGALGVAAMTQNQSGTAVIKDPEDPEKSQMDETREFGGMTGAPISADMLGFSGGGEAQGTDVIPAMLTPGEFIMSRGAVEAYGLDFMEGINASAGGTNKPKKMGGTTYAAGGGSIDEMSRQQQAAMESRRQNDNREWWDFLGMAGTGNKVKSSEGNGLKGLTAQDYRDLAFIVSAEAQRGTDDEYGVAAAILNRVADPSWPNTIKAVGSQAGQFEAVFTGKAYDDPALAEKLASKEGQRKIAGALNKLQGRTDFKGTSQYANMGQGDIKFSSRGNFYHYKEQVGKNDPPPSPPPSYYKKFVGPGGSGITLAGTGSSGASSSASSASGGNTKKTDWSKVKGISGAFESVSGTNRGIASGKIGNTAPKLNIPAPPPVRSGPAVSAVSQSESSSGDSPLGPNSNYIPPIPIPPPSLPKAKILGISI